MPTTEPLDSVSGKRQRRRPTTSCEPCRSRKVKCDRGLPCRPCRRSRASLQCNYKSDQTPGSARSPYQCLSPRIDAEPDVNEPINTPERPHDKHPYHLLNQGHQLEDERSESLSHRIRALEETQGHDELESTGSASKFQKLEARIKKLEQKLAGQAALSNPTDKHELKVVLPRPHLRAEHEKTRLFGKNHWIHSLEQFNILSQLQSNSYATVDGGQLQTEGAMSEAANTRRWVKGRGAELLQDPMPSLKETVPVRSVCDQAIDGYLRTYEPMFRILHVPSFLKEYEDYWADINPVRTEFLMKLTMVIAIGAVFFSDHVLSMEIKKAAHNWVYAVQWWLVGPTERDAMSIGGVQVFCLSILARQTFAIGGTASIITESLLKLSFTIGLHLDPRFLPAMTPLESELRRRLWTTVLELTTITSFNSTLPLLVSLDHSRIRLPSNIADSQLSNDRNKIENWEKSNYKQLDCSLQLLLAKSLRLRMKLVRELNDMSCESSYQKVLDATETLKSHCREIALFFQPSQAGNQLNSMSPSFHSKFLDSYFRRLILFLHRPFSNRATKDARFFLSRKICLECSLTIASHITVDNPDLSLPSDDDYLHCCMAGSGMFKGPLGLDVICAVSLELVTQLEEEGASDIAQADSRRADPLTNLSRAGREPLINYLERSRDQWKQLIALGRPSVKQYSFISCMLSHMKSMESGGDQKSAMIETIKTSLRECTRLMQDSPAYGSISEGVADWTDVSSFDIDPMTLFGFDSGVMDPDTATNMPDWYDTPSPAEIHNVL
ncbi:hypothetical protein GGR57DRAFT_475064 [Xylariaceae sp. FL1272]|nr:hypothetical protein GGR57DRAFT_475064 [Xylariaceae sp. FL1272]